MKPRKRSDPRLGIAESLFREAELREQRGNFSLAFNAYLEAAKMGNALCQLAVGNIYSSGSGVPKDLDQASIWYRRAYRQGLSSAAINLAIDLQNSGKVKGAIAWYKRAVAMNDGEANLQLAQLYMRRRGGGRFATPLLEQALRLGPGRLSGDSRKEVTELLRKLTRVEV